MAEKLSLTALRISDLVIVLQKSGARLVSEESIQEDIRAGAPINEDGTVNFIKYTAWLLNNR